MVNYIIFLHALLFPFLSRVYVYVCLVCVCAFIYSHVEAIGQPQASSSGTSSSHWLWSPRISLVDWLVSSRSLPVSISPVLGAFYLVTGGWTQVLTVARKHLTHSAISPAPSLVKASSVFLLKHGAGFFRITHDPSWHHTVVPPWSVNPGSILILLSALWPIFPSSVSWLHYLEIFSMVLMMVWTRSPASPPQRGPRSSTPYRGPGFSQNNLSLVLLAALCKLHNLTSTTTLLPPSSDYWYPREKQVGLADSECSKSLTGCQPLTSALGVCGQSQSWQPAALI